MLSYKLGLGKNIGTVCGIDNLACFTFYLNMFSREANGSFLPPTTSLHLERLREAFGGCLGCWEPLPLLLGFSIFIHGVFPLLMKERIYTLEVLMRRGGTIRAWSIYQKPWQRACIFSLVSISSLSLQFVKPRFATLES